MTIFDIERINIDRARLAPGMNWQPKEGAETRSLRNRLRSQPDMDDAACDRLVQSAAGILGRGSPPLAAGGMTGLVLGQVQSGKTLSFTTTAAMARDNYFRIVIVITGTSTTLLDQSVGRLRRDLGIESGNRNWRHVHVVPQETPDVQVIRDTLAEWRDATVLTQDKRSLLITVMKQHQNLSRLINVLEQLDLDEVPVLIIDDEADQASLNIRVRQKDESTTYGRLRDLRKLLPRHLYLQYTATPQALLLINIIGILSPDFAYILEPGPAYRGGRAFFLERPELVRDIPLPELPTRQQPLLQPPSTLFEALRLFFVGVAAAMVQGTSGSGNRSMMIHPSERTDQHRLFEHWVRMAKEEWFTLLERPDTDPDKIELLAEFRQAEADLRATDPGTPPMDELFGQLKHAIRRTRVLTLNARGGRTPPVNWSDSYSFVLLGGNAMERGFTVRGLTVTYMPRSLGQGTADTLQQRGRFFGYYRDDRPLGLCRVFLARDVRRAFMEYVESEEDIRSRLVAHGQTGRHLAEWQRAFLLDSSMKPTRDSVIDVAYQWANLGGDRWFWTKSPHHPSEQVAQNQAIIDRLRRDVTFVPDDGHPNRSEYQKHLVARGLRLQSVLETLLVPLRVLSPHDSQQYVSVLLVLRRLVEDMPDATATIYLMSPDIERDRTPDEKDRLAWLFQGASPVSPASVRGSVYPGDEAIRDATGVTIQVHTVRVTPNGATPIQRVPTIAIWGPPTLNRDLLVQPQGGTE